MGSSHESEPSCGRGEIESVTPTQRRAGGRVGIPDGAVNAATPMVDCYSAKSGRFARNLELLGPIAHWLGRALLVRGLPPPTACPTPTSVPAAPGPNLTPVKPERREGLNCKKRPGGGCFIGAAQAPPPAPGSPSTSCQRRTGSRVTFRLCIAFLADAQL